MARLVELEPTKFVRFLADLWTQRNWQTNVQPRGEGRYLVQGQRGDGAKGMMLVLPTAEGTVEMDHVRGFVAHAKKRQIDVISIATQGEFTDEVRGFSTKHDVTLLDLDTLGETVEDEELEETVKQYTDGDVYETAEVEFGLPFDLPEPVANAVSSLPLDSIRARLSGNSGDSDVSLRDRLPSSLEDLKSGSPPSVRVVVVAVLLLVLALGSVAALGPVVDGLGTQVGQRGVSVSAVSSAPSSSADLVARWNTQTTDSVAIGNDSYTAPEGTQFVVVALNVSANGSSPGSLPSSSLVLESDSVRYGYQPLTNKSGFANGGLFAPNESERVWTVFSVPENTTTGTLLVSDSNGDTVAFVHDETVSAEPTDSA
ncbi:MULTISPECIES: restriction endonuclease [Haloferax]|uniref:Restriction endonuclease type IV Mrr domain-containing protein n=2 Tax=Haloferax TaxID=2251 RepID=A0A6G1Z5M4_9EURY|nr:MULTISPECIES: restriction endonuclease [Haloferax]KAB1189121.1 restriction endonuclease [Haloferax sp. CBA1149]MRW81856.1 hypothetical protein [Haloferax marinisediminis]